jgi:hypothetical protein
VVTGEAAAEPEPAEAPSLFETFDRPLVVFVYGAASADDDTMDKIEDVVFKNEKVALGMKAFRAVRIAPEDAAKDPLIAGEGKDVPRVLVIDPVKEKITVLGPRKIKASKLFGAMKHAAKSCYDANLESIVKKHIKILNEQDKLAGEMKVLRDKETRLAEDGDKNEKKLADIREEIEAIEKEAQELATSQRELWKLQRPESAA